MTQSFRAALVMSVVLTLGFSGILEGQRIPGRRPPFPVLRGAPLISLSPWLRSSGFPLVTGPLEPLGHPGLLTPVSPRLEAYLRSSPPVVGEPIPFSGPASGRTLTVAGGGLMVSGALVGGGFGQAAMVAGLGLGAYGVRLLLPRKKQSARIRWRPHEG
ncbi:hypothetical protein ACFL3S_03035 [Gemmatimonadota bacterium]